MKIAFAFLAAVIVTATIPVIASENSKLGTGINLINYSDNISVTGIPDGEEITKKNSVSGIKSSYTTGIGLRGGFTSGITLKHFIKSNAALELTLGTRWHGLSIQVCMNGIKKMPLMYPDFHGNME